MVRSLNELVSLFLDWSGKVHAPNTTAAYKHQLAKFAGRFGHRPIDTLKAIDLQECKKTWHLYQAVQRLFNWASVDAEIIEKNPFNKLKRPPIGQRRRTISVPIGAVLLRNAKPHFRRLMLAYRETFARPGELRQARFDHLQTTDGTANLEQALERGTACIVLWEHKTRCQRSEPNTPRVILLSPRVGRLIVRLKRSASDPAGPIFLTTKKKPWSSNAVRCCFRRLRRRIKLLKDQRGENIVAYTYRHTGATAAAAAGIRDKILAEILGHASTRTTARYQHLNVEHLHPVMMNFWKRSNQKSKPQ